jgi:hypothetical protein
MNEMEKAISKSRYDAERDAAQLLAFKEGYEAGKAAAREGEVDENGLRSCPFCKGTSSVHSEDGGPPTIYWPQCDECGAALKNYLSSDAATEAWNRRKSDG